MFYITDTFVKFQILIGCSLFEKAKMLLVPAESGFSLHISLPTSYLTPLLGHLDCLGHSDGVSIYSSLSAMPCGAQAY